MRLSYVVTLIFAISDNHPMVRCERFFQEAQKCLDAPEEVKQAWNVTSGEGWKRCVMALGNLTADSWSGKFGAVPSHAPSPLHALMYGVPFGPTNLEMLRKAQQAERSMWKVRKLLPMFEGVLKHAAVDPSIELPRDTPEPADRIGVYGLAEAEVQTVREAFGEARIEVFEEPSRGTEPDLGRAAALAQERFFASVSHVVIHVKDLRSMTLFWGAMSLVERRRLASVTCVVDAQLETTLRSMLDNASKLAQGPGLSYYETSARLSFVFRFDLARLQAQLDRTSASRAPAGRAP